MDFNKTLLALCINVKLHSISSWIFYLIHFPSSLGWCFSSWTISITIIGSALTLLHNNPHVPKAEPILCLLLLNDRRSYRKIIRIKRMTIVACSTEQGATICVSLCFLYWFILQFYYSHLHQFNLTLCKNWHGLKLWKFGNSGAHVFQYSQSFESLK